MSNRIKEDALDAMFVDLAQQVTDLVAANKDGVYSKIKSSDLNRADVTISCRLEMTPKSHDVRVKFKAVPVFKILRDKRQSIGEDPDQLKLPLAEGQEPAAETKAAKANSAAPKAKRGRKKKPVVTDADTP